MTTYFISDLHLDDERPLITALLLEFLEGPARAAAALYILGDLFESWIGDDDDAELAQSVQAGLARLTASGVPVYFIAGNRDFLVGEGFAANTGVTLLADPTLIRVDERAYLVMHGDTLCTDDTAYQQFRRQVRDPAWQQQFLSQPLQQRRAFARHAREQSRLHTGSAQAEIMDVTDAAVAAVMREHGVYRLIHGHTHRPATHYFGVDDEPAERIVLGDWYEQGSVLRIEDGNAQLLDWR